MCFYLGADIFFYDHTSVTVDWSRDEHMTQTGPIRKLLWDSPNWDLRIVLSRRSCWKMRNWHKPCLPHCREDRLQWAHLGAQCYNEKALHIWLQALPGACCSQLGSGQVALPAAAGLAGAHSTGQVFLLVCSILPFVTLSGRNSGFM